MSKRQIARTPIGPNGEQLELCAPLCLPLLGRALVQHSSCTEKEAGTHGRPRVSLAAGSLCCHSEWAQVCSQTRYTQQGSGNVDAGGALVAPVACTGDSEALCDRALPVHALQSVRQSTCSVLVLRNERDRQLCLERQGAPCWSSAEPHCREKKELFFLNLPVAAKFSWAGLQQFSPARGVCAKDSQTETCALNKSSRLPELWVRG